MTPKVQWEIINQNNWHEQCLFNNLGSEQKDHYFVNDIFITEKSCVVWLEIYLSLLFAANGLAGVKQVPSHYLNQWSPIWTTPTCATDPQ